MIDQIVEEERGTPGEIVVLVGPRTSINRTDGFPICFSGRVCPLATTRRARSANAIVRRKIGAASSAQGIVTSLLHVRYLLLPPVVCY